MARRKAPRIPDALLDQLLARADPNTAFDANGLLDELKKAFAERAIEPCIPSRKKRRVAITHDAALYKKRHRIENMFGRLKDGRRVATRYDRCADIFLSACALAALVIFWL